MSKNRRILYVGGFELPDKNAAAQRVLGNAKVLRELGYEVVFLDVDKEILNDELSPLHDTEGFTTFSQKHATSFKGLLKYCYTPLHVKEVLSKYDDWVAVIAYNYPALALYKLLRLCHQCGLKLYGDSTEWHNLGRFSLKFIFIQVDMFFRMRLVHKHLDGMIVISHYLENYYKKYTKTIVLPPLVDAYALKWKRGTRPPHLGLKFVFFGTLGAKKELLNNVVEVLLKLPKQVQLQIVGLSLEQYIMQYPYEKEIVTKLIDQKQVFFLGRLPHLKALEIVKNSDFSIFYRRRTRTNMAGFPTKFVESISCGVPVITTDTSDLIQYTKNGKNAILLPPEHFTQALIELVDALSLHKHSFPTVEQALFDYRNYTIQMKSFMED